MRVCEGECIGMCKAGCGRVSIVGIFDLHTTCIVHNHSISIHDLEVEFYEVKISDSTKEFLPGDGKELLN